jgi:BlaI family transcriptional regulator, penicillinase repressor
MIYWTGSTIPLVDQFWFRFRMLPVASMDRDPPIPSERELQALKILWRRGEATVREVFDELATRGEQLAYTTVLSLFQTMEQKGLVTHRAEGKVYYYAASVRRESTFRRLARGILDTVFDGAMDEYVVHALSSRPMTATELTRLETMLAEARERVGSGKKTDSPATHPSVPPTAPPATNDSSSRGRKRRSPGGDR